MYNVHGDKGWSYKCHQEPRGIVYMKKAQLK